MENMENSKTKNIGIIALVVIVIGVGAFFLFKGGNSNNNGNNGNNGGNNSTESKNVTLSATDLKVKKGSVVTFDISTKNAVGRVDIASSDTNVATVNDEGMVTAVGSGSATILAKSILEVNCSSLKLLITACSNSFLLQT